MAMAEQQYSICLQDCFAESFEEVEVERCPLAGDVTVVAMG